MLIERKGKARPPPADGPAIPLPAARHGPTRAPVRSERVPDALILAGGLLLGAVGVTVMVAWWARATALLLFNNLNPVSFNTALAFAVTGVALVALARGRPRVALAAGLLDALLGAAVLAEYILSRSLGIDQLLMKAYIAGPYDVPGRPAINTAVCLTLTGVAFLVWGPWRHRRRPAAPAIAGSAIAVIGAIATVGYATGNPVAYGWSHVATMAFLSAVSFLVLGLCLLSAAWRDARASHAGLPRWLPVPAGALALGLVIWLAIAGRAVAVGHISGDAFTTNATVLGLIMAGLVALAVWLAQRADGRRQVAVAAIQTLNASLEQRVQQRTGHLERANQQLAAFTYSAAHDLRTPLRGISGFAEALAEEYGDRLDDVGRGYAGRIQAASGHMGAVIDDLLDLSRVSRAEVTLQEVDLSAEATAICDQLRTRDPGRRIRVTVEDGIRVTADRPLIRTVLENLLGNAWKFTAGRDKATIEFGTVLADDGSACYYVRDNGAGFDPAYTDKLFTPFERLHTAAQFSGTGIGLAIVQRIIDRHEGQTGAEGAIDRGATFYFTLNAEEAL